MLISRILRYSLLILSLVSVLVLGFNSCAAPEEAATKADAEADSETTSDDETTTNGGDTTTTTVPTTTSKIVTGIIYQPITVKRKQSNLNFDNAQFGNIKFQ